MNILSLLSKKVKKALISVIGYTDFEPKVCQSTKAYFGDYQVNGVMSIAKRLNVSSKHLAEQVQMRLDLTNIASKTEVVGPGFINIFLDSTFLAKNINLTLKSAYLGITKPNPKTVIVDYSSPNVAKEMHVGHLRSTIIGDAMVRTLEFLGHKVIRANHIGDWGTQFGMLIALLEEKEQNSTRKIVLENLESFYQEAKKRFDEDKNFSERARNYVVKLQSGDEYSLRIWKKLVTLTMIQNQMIYDRLNVSLTIKDVKGESFYNAMLPSIVTDLKEKGLAVDNEGAIVVFLDEFKDKTGKATGIIIQKRDGGYLYTTTDIACIKYRYETLRADRILYYTDSRQYKHLAQAWTIAKKAGYVSDSVSLEHHMFGMILNKEGKPFKTRSGGTVKLSELLNEAIIRARSFLIKRNPTKSSSEIERLSIVVGIGALKYADLSRNRIDNYIFDWNNMLTFEGNTAPYIQYAYTRARSIFRKAGILLENDENKKKYTFSNTKIVFSEDYEMKLAVRLLQFEETLNIISQDGTFHVMCTYLYDIAGLFSNFYEHCPILSIENKIIRDSRLKLALLTAKILKLGLHILGIKTVERM